MGRQPPASGHNVKLPVSLYASAVMAAEHRRESVGQYVERAVAAQLERDRHAYKVAKLDALKREAARNNRPTPCPSSVGLPRDFGLPPAMRG